MVLIADNPYWSGNIGAPAITNQTDLTNLINASGSGFYAQLNWTDIEPIQGNPYVWTNANSIMSTLESNNLRICFVLQGAPSWHQSVVAGSGDPATYITPADAATYITNVINQFPGQLQYIILGNESYSNYKPSNGLKDPAIGYGLLQACYSTIKSLDSTIQVGMFPLLNGKTQANINAWWNIAFTGNSPQFGQLNPLVNYCDFLTLHYYSGTTDPNAPNGNGLTMASWLTSFQNIRSQYGPALGKANIPLFITEYGWTASNNPNGTQVTPAQQATYETHFLDTARQSGVVTHVSYFNIGGLFTNNGATPRQAYTNLKNYALAFPQWTPPIPKLFTSFSAHA